MPRGEHARKLSDEQRARVVHLYTTRNPDGTWTGTKTLAQMFGVSINAIANLLKVRGVRQRSARESHAHGKRCKPIKNLPVGTAPPCACGCTQPVAWNQRKNRWNRYVEGHYRRHAPYKDADWLRGQYAVRNLSDIARECGVNPTTITRYMDRFGIPRRSQAESLALGGKVSGSKNPAWKGGVAKWEYASNWKRIAHSIRKRDNYTCQVCKVQFPKASKLLHVHHIDGHKLNNEPENLVTVCATCHPKGKRKETRASFHSR